MRKLSYICIILCVFLCGCTGKISIDEQVIADDVFQEIVVAIKQNDAAALKKLFSETAKNNSPTLDADIDRFLAIFDKEVSDYYSTGGVNTSNSYDHGKLSINLKPAYAIVSKGETFYIGMQYYVIDTYDPSNMGIYSLCIIHSSQMPVGYVYSASIDDNPGITFDSTDYCEKFK